jgi:hypothetical protein
MQALGNEIGGEDVSLLLLLLLLLWAEDVSQIFFLIFNSALPEIGRKMML